MHSLTAMIRTLSFTAGPQAYGVQPTKWHLYRQWSFTTRRETMVRLQRTPDGLVTRGSMADPVGSIRTFIYLDNINLDWLDDGPGRGKQQQHICTDCGIWPQDVRHLFACKAHLTDLSPEDPWRNPEGSMAESGGIDSCVQLPRRQEPWLNT